MSPCGSTSCLGNESGAGEWCGDAQATSCCALEVGKALLGQLDLPQVAALEMRHLFEAQRALYVNVPGANDGTYGDQESSDPSFTELYYGDHFVALEPTKEMHH